MIADASTAIRSRLLAVPAITTLVGNKIFMDAAPGSTAYPYIGMFYYSGADENTSPRDSFDIIMRVNAVSNNQLQAETLAGLINTALVHQHLDYPNSWLSYAKVTQVGLWYDKDVIANVQYYAHGALYRLRASK